MKITAHPYQGERDFLRVRDFLIHTYARNQNQHNWTIEHWDYARYFATYFIGPGVQFWEADIRLWEDENGAIVGAVWHEGQRGEVFLQIHPDYRHLENEMITWAESALSIADNQGNCRLHVWAYDFDTPRQTLLHARGYHPTGEVRHAYRRSLGTPIADAPLPEGYKARSLRDEDITGRRIAMGRAFGSNPVSKDVYWAMQTAPGYRDELDLIISAPDGTLAAFTTVWFDPVNLIGIFEPVGTDPKYQQRGLGKAVMTEGFRRLKALGTEMAYVGTGEAVAANALYRSLGFELYAKEVAWERIW